MAYKSAIEWTDATWLDGREHNEFPKENIDAARA